MLDPIVTTALVCGGLLSLLLGPLGCFVVWRHMAYFGDAIAHAALLGVALSLLLSLPMLPAIFAVALMVAVILTAWARDTRFHEDTLLGFLAHGTLAIGLLLVSLNKDAQIDLNAFLFGDILAITWDDMPMIAGLVVLGLGALILHWRGLVLATLEPNLARVEGVPVSRLNYLLVLVLAGTIAIAIQFVGVLLITALLIMPAAAARPISRSPKRMAIIASLLCMVAISGGLGLSLKADVPTGPMIVVVSLGLCIATLSLDRIFRRQ